MDDRSCMSGYWTVPVRYHSPWWAGPVGITAARNRRLLQLWINSPRPQAQQCLEVEHPCAFGINVLWRDTQPYLGVIRASSESSHRVWHKTSVGTFKADKARTVTLARGRQEGEKPSFPTIALRGKECSYPLI